MGILIIALMALAVIVTAKLVVDRLRLTSTTSQLVMVTVSLCVLMAIIGSFGG